MPEKSVTKDMKLGELAEKYPESVEIMFNYGLHCVGCHVASFETLEQGAKAHGMSDEDIDKMVGEINKAINEPKEEKDTQKSKISGTTYCGTEKEEKEEELETETKDINEENMEKKKGFFRGVLSKLF